MASCGQSLAVCTSGRVPAADPMVGKYSMRGAASTKKARLPPLSSGARPRYRARPDRANLDILWIRYRTLPTSAYTPLGHSPRNRTTWAGSHCWSPLVMRPQRPCAVLLGHSRHLRGGSKNIGSRCIGWPAARLRSISARRVSADLQWRHLCGCSGRWILWSYPHPEQATTRGYVVSIFGRPAVKMANPDLESVRVPSCRCA